MYIFVDRCISFHSLKTYLSSLLMLRKQRKGCMYAQSVGGITHIEEVYGNTWSMCVARNHNSSALTVQRKWR